MAPKTQTLIFTRTVNAPPSAVYRAFTKSTALREWLCDMATSQPRKAGRLYMWWTRGYYVCGEFTALTPDKKVVFTWQRRGEPAATKVQVTIAPKKDGTLVTVAHAGVGSGKAWAKTVKAIARGWEAGLENLQSVLETGEDLRITLRPMLGITLSDLNAEIAAKLGVPVKEGIRLDGTVEGMGARAAGLQKDDVMVGMNGKKITDWTSLINALQGRRAGDTVSVIFYRGGEKKAVNMQLSKRPLPEVPPTPQALAEAVRKTYAELDAELDECFKGVTEEEASFKPAPGEWSAKDVVAHLLTGERDWHLWIIELLGDEERWHDDWPGNINERHAGVLAVYPTVSALLGEYKRAEAETVAILAALPPEFAARKSTFWRLAYNYLQPPLHNREHFGQIRAAIEAARRK